MAATFISGSAASNGGSYAAASGTDTLLVWVPTGYRSGTTTGSLQTYGGVSLTERNDTTINLTGGGDPTGNLSDLVNPSTTSGTLSVTFSSGLSNNSGYALTLDSVDQTTPHASSNDGTYNVDNSPSFTIDAPTNSTIVYWRHHAANLGGGTPSWTPPTGFTERFSDTLITSPAYREFRVFTRDVTTALTSFSLAATTTGTAIGGIHGYAVYNEASGGTTITGSGAFSSQVSTVSGTSLIERTSSGALSSQSSSVDGTATLTSTLTGSGSLVAQPSSLSSLAERILTASGSLLAPVASVSGVANTGAVLSASGTLLSQVAQLSAIANIEKTSSGSLQPSSSIVIGVAEVHRLAAGVLTSQSSSVIGVSEISKTSSGALTAQPSTTSGSGVVGSATVGSGSLLPQQPVISGVSLRELVGVGSLISSSSTISGVSSRSLTATGSVVSTSSTVSGVSNVVSGVFGAGTLASQQAVMSGVGSVPTDEDFILGNGVMMVSHKGTYYAQENGIWLVA